MLPLARYSITVTIFNLFSGHFEFLRVSFGQVFAFSPSFHHREEKRVSQFAIRSISINIFQHFLTLQMSDSRFSDVLMPNCTFLCLPIVSVQPECSSQICVYNIICQYTYGIIRYWNSLNMRNFNRFIILVSSLTPD